jgi:hypothetical protein
MTAAAVITTVVTVARASVPSQYTATVVLRATEGTMRTEGELGVGALRVHLRELTFTRTRLEALMRQHPAEFPAMAKDREAAVEKLAEQIKVDITMSDFIDESGEGAPPRSARITLAVTGASPAGTWKLAQALADLLIDSAMDRQRAALLREQTGAESAVETAQQKADDKTAPDSRPRLGRLKQIEAQAAAARLGLRAAQEQQTLRFELVDPGRVPAANRSSLVGDALLTLTLALLVSGILAGAFDPRIIGAGDLVATGVPLLGRLPPPPGPPQRAQPPQHTEKDGPPPSDDSRPRV